jgi:hypothetical protein
MTALELLETLAEFIREHTKDLILETRGKEINEDEREPDGERTAYIYKMRLPDENAVIDNIPYILLQVLTGSDEQEEGQSPTSECKIRIVVVTYSSDYSKGKIDVMNIIERLRIALLRQEVIGGKFQLKHPIERVYYPDDQAPYFDGEMMTNWFLPPVYRKVNYGNNYYNSSGENGGFIIEA